jgi:phosphoribosylaminoimidazole-succinocarboxamide synthase
MKIPLCELTTPFYEGSVQRLFAVPGDATRMVTQTSARGSVFDVGALFEIAGHDVNRALFRHVLFTSLGDPATWERVAEAIAEDGDLDPAYREKLLAGTLEKFRAEGAHTHHEGMLDAVTGEVCRAGVPEHPSAYNVVRRYQILKPSRVDLLGAHLFDYHRFASEDGFVVPLEYIVRFGITTASSVFRKYQSLDPSAQRVFAQELGAVKGLAAWEMLERPILDFTSKFEPEDRMVSKQEAFAMSGLDGRAFVAGGQLAVLGAWAVRQLIEPLGLRLWDLKWEFAKDGEDLVFVDTIDTDSIRATLFVEDQGGRFVIHFNKQAMRDYFSLLHGDWIAAIKLAKVEGLRQGVAFTEILAAGQASGERPATPSVDPVFLDLQERKMRIIREHLLGQGDPDNLKQALMAAGIEEVTYYRERGVITGFRAINGI